MNTFILLAAFTVIHGNNFASAASAAVPQCLTNCMTKVTQPCSPSSLPNLITCLYSDCSTSPSSSPQLDFSFCPKAEASCQTSDSQQQISLTVKNDGSCTSSPFDFVSFVPHASNTSVTQACSMILYSDDACADKVSELALAQAGEGCMAGSGRSAKLDCGSGDSSFDVSPILQDLGTTCASALQSDGGNAVGTGTSTGKVLGTGTPSSIPSSNITTPVSPTLSATATVVPSNGAVGAVGQVSISFVVTLVVALVLVI